MIQRGDIWLVDFSDLHPDPKAGPAAYTRPAIVVSNDGINHSKLLTVIVIPGTTHPRRLPQHLLLHPHESGLQHRTVFQPELLTTGHEISPVT
ncbi:MAG: type II toxin-antitoxin system PemK/MazF family toxin [Phycisphaerales bacterium]|nr:type II toxin-antitoxin system PemK/MazF family toxin [Phycisphaerales bacterium]